MGCSGFNRKIKSLFSGNSAKVSKRSARRPSVSYNKRKSYQTNLNRNYKRMTKKKLIQDSGLSPRSGSLWVMEGQGAYLFSQNIVRLIGDPLSVKIVGEPQKQLETKVDVIKDLLKRQSARSRLAKRDAARKARDKDKGKGAKKKAKPKARNIASDKNDKDGLDSKFGVNSVQTRIVERLVDGNYRVKGSQSFMIGRREYKVILTGIVRSDDFAEDGVPATKLLDSKFDIVSVRKKRSRL